MRPCHFIPFNETLSSQPVSVPQVYSSFVAETLNFHSTLSWDRENESLDVNIQMILSLIRIFVT